MRHICTFVPAATHLAPVPGPDADLRPTTTRQQTAALAGTTATPSQRTTSKPLLRSIRLAGKRAGAGAPTPVGAGRDRRWRLAAPPAPIDSVRSRS
jgi:hypothetical protein